MRFLVDAQLPPAVAAWLRRKGHEAQTVKDVDLRDADDALIWSFAESTGATIVTKDEDFALLAARTAGPTVLWVRSGNLVNRLLLARLEQAWPEIEGYFAAGANLVELR